MPDVNSNPITLELLDHQLQRVQDHINAFEQTISLQLKAMDARLDQMDAKLKLIDVRLDQQDLKFQRVGKGSMPSPTDWCSSRPI